MAFKAGVLAFILSASLAGACRLAVTVDYTGEAPAPSCEMDCSVNPDLDSVEFGTKIHTFEVVPFLRDEYNQMVEIVFEENEFKTCVIVPYKTPEELESEYGVTAAEEDAGEEEAPVSGEGEVAGEEEAAGTCGAMFTSVAGKCYAVSPDKLNWNDAKSYCESLGGALATIGSMEENDALAAFLTTSVYIGLNDRNTEKDFRNTDDSPAMFKNFNTGEPNNVGNEDCVVMKDNKGFRWNDVKCSKKFSALCQENTAM